MNKQKKHGALFYVLAVIFFPITLTVLIVRLCVRQKEKPPHGGGGKNANVIGETIGGKPTIYNGGVNYGGTFKGHGKAELYSIILPTHTKRDISKMTDKQIEAAAVVYARNGANIIEDSDRLVETTTSPDTFFKRLFVLGGRLHANAVIEKYYPIFNTKQGRQYKRFLQDAPKIVNAFIDRYARETLGEIAHRQTPAARCSYIQKRYDTLDRFAEYMTAESYNYFNRVFADMLARFEK